MLRDTNTLMNIQIAFMGIVLVVGLFYLWKMLKGLENKVNKLSATVNKLQDQLEARGAAPVAMNDAAAAEDAMAQAFMNEVFGGSTAPAFLHAFAPSAKAAQVVILEDANAVASEPLAEEPTNTGIDVDLVDADTASVMTTSTISKSKVRKMSAEALRELCKERGIDAEGTRAVLMERVLATLEE